MSRHKRNCPDIIFKGAVPHLEEMLDLCKQLSQRDLSRLTHQQLTAIATTCATLAESAARDRSADGPCQAPSIPVRGATWGVLQDDVDVSDDQIADPLRERGPAAGDGILGDHRPFDRPATSRRRSGSSRA